MIYIFIIDQQDEDAAGHAGYKQKSDRVSIQSRSRFAEEEILDLVRTEWSCKTLTGDLNLDLA